MSSKWIKMKNQIRNMSFWVPIIHWRRNHVNMKELQTSEIEIGHAQTCTRSCAHDMSTHTQYSRLMTHVSRLMSYSIVD